jgi:alcohol dehydrogenase class IV
VIRQVNLSFEFATAAKIVFGPGRVHDLPAILRPIARSALVLTGQNGSRAEPVIRSLEQQGLTVGVLGVGHEPTIDLVRRYAAEARGFEAVLGIGGGSVMDAAKAVAAMAANSGEPLDYLEVIGKGKQLEHRPLPWVAVPTTAGTGAEVTRNAVLDSPEHGAKASLRDQWLAASVAVIDPDLTLSLPPDVTAWTGLDALTQLIEAYVSIRANALTDLFCLEGLKRVQRSLARAYHDGANQEARENMSFAALLSGLTLANAGLGVVHGFAAPLGGTLHAPHGALCAAVLPFGMRANIRALRERAPEHPAVNRYRTVSRLLTCEPGAEPEQACEWVAGLCRRLRIPGLARYGLTPPLMPALIEKASLASSMKANPLPLRSEELEWIVNEAL